MIDTIMLKREAETFEAMLLRKPVIHIGIETFNSTIDKYAYQYVTDTSNRIPTFLGFDIKLEEFLFGYYLK